MPDLVRGGRWPDIGFDGREHGCRRALVMPNRAGRKSPQVWQHTASVQAPLPSLARVRGGRHQARPGRATPSPLLPCAAPAARSAPTPAALLQPACSKTGRSWLPAGPPRSRSRCALEAAVPVAQMPASQPVQTSAARDQGPQAARPSCAAARPAGEALRAPQTLAHTSTSGSQLTACTPRRGPQRQSHMACWQCQTVASTVRKAGHRAVIAG